MSLCKYKSKSEIDKIFVNGIVRKNDFFFVS